MHFTIGTADMRFFLLSFLLLWDTTVIAVLRKPLLVDMLYFLFRFLVYVGYYTLGGGVGTTFLQMGWDSRGLIGLEVFFFF